MKTIVKSDSELIAEFMGWSDLGNKGVQWYWLMPVVEEIEGISSTQVNIYTNHCRIAHKGVDFESLGSTKIEATYKAVVEFIKWHNQK
jgi:hypothetical protein